LAITALELGGPQTSPTGQSALVLHKVCFRWHIFNAAAGTTPRSQVSAAAGGTQEFSFVMLQMFVDGVQTLFEDLQVFAVAAAPVSKLQVPKALTHWLGPAVQLFTGRTQGPFPLQSASFEHDLLFLLLQYPAVIFGQSTLVVHVSPVSQVLTVPQSPSFVHPPEGVVPYLHEPLAATQSPLLLHPLVDAFEHHPALHWLPTFVQAFFVVLQTPTVVQLMALLQLSPVTLQVPQPAAAQSAFVPQSEPPTEHVPSDTQSVLSTHAALPRSQ